MTEASWLSAVALSILVPWALGMLVTVRVLARSECWNVWLLAGHGYVLGIALTTFIIRACDAVGLGIGLTPLLVTQALLALAILASLHTHWPTVVAHVAPRRPGLARWELVLVLLLLAWLALRLFTLTQEMSLRPLFAWDAWMNWVPKALVYFHNSELSTFVSPEAWLSQSGTKIEYTLGNYSAWKYPITVPLIQYWGMLSTGNPDNPLIYLHWPMLLFALTLALYGHLRLAGMRVIHSLLCAYLLLSVPYANVHTALVGYADLWLGAAFGLGVFSLHAWKRTKDAVYAVLLVAYAMICLTLKMPGIILCALLMAVLAVSAVKLSVRSVLAILATAVAVAALVLFVGMELQLPGLGQVVLTSERITLPLLGTVDLVFHPVQSAFFETFFYSDNWNLLWPFFVIALLSLFVSRKLDGAEAAVLIAILLLMAFLFVVFFFTNHYRTALDFTTLNRALLYCVPAMVLFIALRAQRHLSS